MSTVFFIDADLKFSVLNPLPDITFGAGFTATAGGGASDYHSWLLTADPLEDGPARMSSKAEQQGGSHGTRFLANRIVPEWPFA